MRLGRRQPSVDDDDDDDDDKAETVPERRETIATESDVDGKDMRPTHPFARSACHKRHYGGQHLRSNSSSFAAHHPPPWQNDGDTLLMMQDDEGAVPKPAKHVASVWPVKREAIVEGDLILGGLMMVHSREDTVTCGPIMPQGGIQALETMLFTLDKINEQGLVPNVTIGAHILDDCDKDTYGLEMAVDFIKGSISNIDDINDYDNCSKGHKKKIISGVVGAASSVTSIQVANLLRLFKIPQPRAE
uniref:Receptor ligand binding region domain-containing protein n=1 Tax=Anopheles atroparvus TaxID=41427 RepID=A0A182IN49_ANOAO